MEIEFINYTPYAEFNNFLNNLSQDPLNQKIIKFKPSLFNTNEKTNDVQERGKNKELELLNNELQHICNKIKESKHFDYDLNNKKIFLQEKIKYLNSLNPTNWKYNFGILKQDVKSQVVAKKNTYTKKDILLIAKVLLAVQKNNEIQNFGIIDSFVEIYLGKTPNIRIYHAYQNLFNSDTKTFLLKMLSYFVSLAKPTYIEIALHTLDIFTNKTHSNIAIELHKEILKSFDEQKYKLIYEQEENFGMEGSCEIFFFSLKKEITDKINETIDKNEYKPKNERNIIEKISSEAKKYFSAKIKKTEIVFDENEYIWKYTTLNSNISTVHWYVGNDYPEKAHPRYSEYILMEKFIKYIVDVKKIFSEKEHQMKQNNVLKTFCVDSDSTNFNWTKKLA